MKNKINLNEPIVVDFETYYDKEYSLSKLTNEQYVRGDKFECIGVSVKFKDNPAVFYPRETGIDVIRKLVTDNPASPVVSHNNTFDMSILSFRYNINPNTMIDTATLARLTGFDRVAGGRSLARLSAKLVEMGIVKEPKRNTVHSMLGIHADDMTDRQWRDYGDYCVLDSELCYELYKYLITQVPHDELLMASVTTKMYTEPAFVINQELLTSYAKELDDNRQKLLIDLASKLGFSCTEELLKTLRSSAKFANLLEELNVEVPTKFSEKKQCYAPALAKTDGEFLNLLEHENELVRQVVEVKLNVSSSIERTRTETFLDIASRGVAPVYLHYASAHTGRYGGGQATNYQNMSKRTREPVLRRSLTAPDGYLVIASDSSQIECRLNAYISNQKDLTDLFLEQRDPYVDMASAIFNKPYDEILHEAKVAGSKEGKKMRNLGKEAVLACGYGMSSTTFANRMRLAGNEEAAEMAERIVTAYRSKNNKIVNFWSECDHTLDVLYSGNKISFGGANGDLFLADGSTEFHGVKIPSIRLPNGVHLFYQNLRKEEIGGRINYVYDQFKDGKFIAKRIWGSVLTENLCQALAFVVLKYQALQIYNSGCPLHLNVHDEWVSVVPRTTAVKNVIAHYKSMKKVPPYLPAGLLDCEVDIGNNYADLKTVDVAKYLTLSI